jgi:hypothetical protein
MLPLALLALAAGCSKDETARPDPTNIRVFNAAPNFESLTFVREERPEAQLTLGAGQALSFDSGEYEFKVDHRNWWQRVLDGSYRLVRIGTSATP